MDEGLTKTNQNLINPSRDRTRKCCDASKAKRRLSSAHPSSGQALNEDRTKRLAIALAKIWKEIDPNSPIFQRYPLSVQKICVNRS